MPFRPLPTVLDPGPLLRGALLRGPVRPPAPSWSEALTRLRVGRTRDGALVQIRLELPGRSTLDVEVLESIDGVEVDAGDASPILRAALARELARRGLTAKVR